MHHNSDLTWLGLILSKYIGVRKFNTDRAKVSSPCDLVKKNVIYRLSDATIAS